MLPEIATAGLTTASLAAGGYAYAAMWPTSKIFGPSIVAGFDPAEFALTFDDGPNDRCTIQLLDILARHEVRATFFMIGRFVRRRRDLVRAVRDAGLSHPRCRWRGRVCGADHEAGAVMTAGTKETTAARARHVGAFQSSTSKRWYWIVIACDNCDSVSDGRHYWAMER